MTASTGSRHGLQHHAGDELDAVPVGLHRVAREDARDGAVARQRHVHDEIVPRHAGDFEQFAVQRIVLDGALDGARLAHEARAVQHLDGLLRGQARGHQLAPAGVAQHQVRLDEAEGDVQVRRDEPLVDVDRRAGGGACPGGGARRVRGRCGSRRGSARRSRRRRSGGFPSGVAGRCRPVAIRMVMFSRGMPARSSRASTGGSTWRLGAGRVISQTEMAALRLPRASSASGGRAARGRPARLRARRRGSASGVGRTRLQHPVPEALRKVHGQPALPNARSMRITARYHSGRGPPQAVARALLHERLCTCSSFGPTEVRFDVDCKRIGGFGDILPFVIYGSVSPDGGTLSPPGV